jgi:UDP-N-acetylmuramate dehydrogenase
MVIDANDPNRRSVGSFFTNPVLSDDAVAAVVEKARAAGLLAAEAQPPRFPAGPGLQKLAAAWLIERAGFHKGERRGPVGLSSAHALALIHHGGGRSADLLAFAREIRDRVAATFGVTLVPEPVVLGLPAGVDPLG